MGYGAALKLGIRHAITPNIAIIDCDGTYNPTDLIMLYRQKGQCDMVVGQRPKKLGLNNLAKFFLRSFSAYAAGVSIPDLNSGLRIFKKDLADSLLHILPNGFSLTSTLTLGALSLPAMIRYIPISYSNRIGHSKIVPLKHFWSFILLILRTLILFNPLKFFLPSSALFALIGIGFLIRDFLSRNLAQGTILMLVNAFILLAIGLLAEAIRTRK
jgi:glycosyltransferase involved in cell wall biosynthesis